MVSLTTSAFSPLLLASCFRAFLWSKCTKVTEPWEVDHAGGARASIYEAHFHVIADILFNIAPKLGVFLLVL